MLLKYCMILVLTVAQDPYIPCIENIKYPEYMNFYISKDFTPNEESMIRNAAGIWNKEIGRNKIQLTKTNGLVKDIDGISTISVSNQYNSEYAGETSVIMSLGTDRKGEIKWNVLDQDIIINRYMLSPDVFYNTILHEFGHTLGMGHVSDITSIMHKDVKENFHILSPFDKATVKKIHFKHYTAINRPKHIVRKKKTRRP